MHLLILRRSSTSQIGRETNKPYTRSPQTLVVKLQFMGNSHRSYQPQVVCFVRASRFSQTYTALIDTLRQKALSWFDILEIELLGELLVTCGYADDSYVW